MILLNSIDCGRFIAQLRKDKRITQTELADLLQVTNKAISRWETGEGYPDVSILPKLAEVLQISVDELLNGRRRESSSPTKRKPYVKFINSGFSAIVLIVSSLVLFLAITYSTYKVWFGVIGYLIPSVVGFLWFFNRRNELFETCEYTDEDKKLLITWTRRVIITLWVITWMIIPQIWIVAQSGNWSNAVANFSIYSTYAIMAGLLAWFFARFLLILINHQFDTKIFKNPDIYVGIIGAVLILLILIIKIIFGINVILYSVLIASPVVIYLIVSVVRLIKKNDSIHFFLRRTVVFGIVFVIYILNNVFYIQDSTVSNIFIEFILPILTILVTVAEFVYILIVIIQSLKKRLSNSLFIYGMHEAMLYASYLTLLFFDVILFPVYISNFKATNIAMVISAIGVYYLLRYLMKLPISNVKCENEELSSI